MDQSNRYRPATTPAQHAVFDQSPSEHIQLASEDAQSREAATVEQRIRLNDRWHGRVIELTLYAEDLLTRRMRRRDQTETLVQLDLRHLDPEPGVNTRIATTSLRAALGLAGVAALGALATLVPSIGSRLLPWMLAPGGGAVAALLLAVYRSYRDYVFYTTHGRAAVLTLRARLGSVKQCRAAATAVSAAIRKADGAAPNVKTERLKTEMREHYRLAASGVISADECARSTGRILAHFG